jgi:hypothetical protein
VDETIWVIVGLFVEGMHLVHFFHRSHVINVHFERKKKEERRRRRRQSNKKKPIGE